MKTTIMIEMNCVYIGYEVVFSFNQEEGITDVTSINLAGHSSDLIAEYDTYDDFAKTINDELLDRVVADDYEGGE